MTHFNILGLQYNPLKENKLDNFSLIEARIKENQHLSPHLIVLPELFNTGILAKETIPKYAEPLVGYSFNKLATLAKQYNTYIAAGSIIEKDISETYKNTMMFISPKGECIAKYRKTHMFSYFGHYEKDIFSAGTEAVVVETEFAKIGLSICYDLRFPELYRTYRHQNVDLIIVVAAWPHPRAEHWITLNKARAIENQAYVVCVNQVGHCLHDIVNCGQSMIIDPWGSVLANAYEEETSIFASIDMHKVKETREIFPVYSDLNKKAYK